MKALNRNWILLTLGLALMGVTSCTTPPPEEGAIELFNGRNLNGWNHVLADASVAKENVWSVRDGVLTCKGDPVGFIYRGPQVADFRMVVEYR
ncbi:MAG TPA: family 16 glycoside hydrolase, partial [Clostridia bacterium]|nr:family 16 glycoside hydrolase [Clostridia bacterium]